MINPLGFLSNNIIGLAEDNAWMFVVAHLYKYDHSLFFKNINYPYGYTFFSNFNQPLSQIPYTLLSFYFNEIFIYNLLLILSFLANLLIAKHIFSKFTHKSIATLAAIVFSFSPFFFYQSRSHLDLMQFWSLGIYIYWLVTNKNHKHYFFLGLYLAIVTAISNYFGFFGGLFTLLYFLVELGFDLLNKSNIIKQTIRNGLLLFGGFCVGISILVFSFNIAMKNLANASLTPIDQISGAKSIEEAIYFSSRPWYFVLPSPENPVLGNLTRSAIYHLQNTWGYWLTSNYFPQEHTASFLGITNIVLAIFGLIFIFRNPIFNKRFYMTLFIIEILLIALTLPPYITISLKEIYTPGYLIHLFFPFFRTTARLGVLILFIHMFFVIKGYQYIESKITNKSLSNLLILIIFAIQITEFFVPFKVTNASNSPEVFKYVAENTQKEDSIATYPYVMAHETFFWMRYYDRPLVNPRSSQHFDAENFTEKINTCNGISKLQALGTNYLIYFKNADTKSKEFFDANLTTIKEFEKDIHNSKDYASIIYRIPRDANCINIEEYSYNSVNERYK